MHFRLFGAAIALFLFMAGLTAQDGPAKDWFLKGPSSGFPGLNTVELYAKLAGLKKGQPVIVAVLDSGVDFEHEDLKAIMWVNPGEIPGNGIDDDNNGYVDDVHGWNFLGNKNGENVQYDNLEVARLYAKYRDMYQNLDGSKLKGKKRREYEFYEQLKAEVEEGKASAGQNFMLYQIVKGAIGDLKKQIGKDDITVEDLENLKTTDMRLMQIAQVLMAQMGEGMTFQEFEKQFNEEYNYFNGRFNYNFNPDYNPRGIVGDNYANLNERGYGNSDVRGPDASHGTHVAGIIGAARGNGIGIDGVADQVRIMSVRTVPDGDERDKDVANAIYYAVDNGAKVINMSFGKGYSPEKRAVDKAVKYAMKKDVLLVHAAGNDGKENSGNNNFPNDRFDAKGIFGPKVARNWIEIGASGWEVGEDLAASFSNYSATHVDVFAPGVEIYSTLPGSTYGNQQGTSMAAPMVSGLAAMLRSYFPDLTAVQVKEIIMASATPHNVEVSHPAFGMPAPFSKLSVTGGTVDMGRAFELAARTPGKNKKQAGSRALSASDFPVVLP